MTYRFAAPRQAPNQIGTPRRTGIDPHSPPRRPRPAHAPTDRAGPSRHTRPNRHTNHSPPAHHAPCPHRRLRVCVNSATKGAHKRRNAHQSDAQAPNRYMTYRLAAPRQAPNRKRRRDAPGSTRTPRPTGQAPAGSRPDRPRRPRSASEYRIVSRVSELTRAPDLCSRSGALPVAVAVGFEPTVGGYPTKHFECFTFGRSDTPPRSTLLETGLLAKIGRSEPRGCPSEPVGARSGQAPTGRGRAAAQSGDRAGQRWPV